MTIEDLKNAIRDDDRAVSPVIGVILMVAITVILAAVIGTFVLDLGSNVQESAPQSSLAVSDHNNDYNEDSPGSSNDAFTLEHDGGDDLSADNIKINIRYAGNNSLAAQWDSGSWDVGSEVTDTLNGGSALTTNDIFSTGDQLTITDDGSNQNFDDKTQFTVSVVDKESGKVIAEGTVTLR